MYRYQYLCIHYLVFGIYQYSSAYFTNLCSEISIVSYCISISTHTYSLPIVGYSCSKGLPQKMFFETALDSFEKSLQQMMHGLKLVAYLDADLLLPSIVVACDIAVIALSIGALGLLAHRALSGGTHRKQF